MTKLTFLNSVGKIKDDVDGSIELKEDAMLRLLDLLLDYVNDKDIREAIESVPM